MESTTELRESLLKYCRESFRTCKCNEDDCEHCPVQGVFDLIKEDKKYEVVEVIIGGEPTPCLWIDEKIKPEDIPDGFYAYDLRDDGLGNYEESTLEPFGSVKVNRAGTLLFIDYIGIEEHGPITFNENTSPNFTGEEMSFEDFAEEYVS